MRRPSGAPLKPLGVCIAGVGLIGGSLGRALRRVRKGGRRVYRVTGLSRSASGAREAMRYGAVDASFTRASEALNGADIVVLCVPVQDIAPVVRRLLPHIPLNAVLTDVGSVKGPVESAVRQSIARRRDLAFVGGHPMAGSEKKGVRNATPVLFRGATCAITGGKPASVARVRRMWKDAGASCVDLSAGTHDRWIALISHLPHLLAFSLIAEASRQDPRIRSLVAGSFRDMTRVAAADPVLWSGVFSMNRTALKAAFREFSSQASKIASLDIKSLRAAIRQVAAQKKAFK